MAFAAATLFDDVGDRLRARDDHRQFDAGTDLLDRLVGLHAGDRVVGDVDRVQAPLVAGIQDVPEEDVADGMFLVRGADDGNRLGFKQGSEIVVF